MKRHLAILALAALLLPWAAHSQEGSTCTLAFYRTDMYDDSWNGCGIRLMQDSIEVGQVYCPVDSSGTTLLIEVDASSPVYLLFIAGQWAYEMGGTVADGSGAVVFTLEHMEQYAGGDTIAVINPPCPTCLQPDGFRVDDISSFDATIGWDMEPGQYAWLVALDGGDTVLEYGPSHHFDNLQPHTRYTAHVATYCGEGDTSHFSHYQFVTECAADGCNVDIVMHDSFGDGWTGNAIDCFLDGEHILTATLTDGHDYTATIDYCTGEELVLVWQHGYFTYEASFTLLVGGVTRTAGNGRDYQTGDTIYVVHGCPNCPMPEDLVISDITGSTASFAWTPTGNATSWSVTVGGGSESTTVNVSEPHYTATGLTTFADYTIEIRALCYDGDSSHALTGSFRTAMCDGGDVVESFDSTMAAYTNTEIPIGAGSYNYSYVQTIIDAEKLTESHTLMAMAFQTTGGGGSDMYNHIDVYLANVEEELLIGGFIMPDSAHQFVQVIHDASFNFTEDGWHLHYFDTNFVWDGASNLLVAVSRNNGSWNNSGRFTVHRAPYGKSRHWRTDMYPIDINDPAISIYSTGDTVVGDLLIYSCEPGTWCEPPTIIGTDPGETSLTVTFAGTATAYEVAAIQGGWVAPAAGFLTEGNSYTLEGLEPSTAYSVGVRALCADGLPSSWTVIHSGTVNDACTAPTELYVDNVTEAGGATFGWTPAGELPIEWQFTIANAAGEHVLQVNLAPTITHYTVGNLTAGEEYTARIRALCDNGGSAWSNSVTFTAGECAPVSNVTAKWITPYQVKVTWSNTEQHQSYEIEYGPVGYTPGQGTLVAYNYSDNYTYITNLNHDSVYDIHMRGICADQYYNLQYGVWSQAATCSYVGINGVDDNRVSLYPNPADDMVVVEGLQGISLIVLHDISGRPLATYTTHADQLTIDTRNLPAGTYFVRVTCDRFTASKKLIKQ